MASNTFFYALIIVGCLVALFLFLRRGQTCTGCSENFAQKLQHPTQKSIASSEEAEYRKKKRKELGLYHDYIPAARTDSESNDSEVIGFASTRNEPWPGYYQYSLYSTMVNPPNTDNYPYMHSPYNQEMDGCSPGCSGSSAPGRQLPCRKRSIGWRRSCSTQSSETRSSLMPPRHETRNDYR